MSDLDRVDRGDLDGKLREVAELMSASSGDTFTKVGAVALTTSGVLFGAWNDIPEGVEDTPERRERPTKYLYTAHAEEALVCRAARQGLSLEGATVYSTADPCHLCARMLRLAGVRRVLVGPSTWTGSTPECREASAAMLDGLNVARLKS